MNSWTPKFFEDEIQSIQPEYNLVYERYSSDPTTLISPFLNSDDETIETNDILIKNPPNDNDDMLREKETVSMMRQTGIETCIGGKLDSKRTLPVRQNSSSVIYQGNKPILLDSKYFSLKPKKPLIENTDTKTINSSILSEENDISSSCTSISFDLLSSEESSKSKQNDSSLSAI